MATDLKKLISRLHVSEETLLHAIAEQPELFQQAAEYRVEKLRDYIAAKAKYEATCAKVGIYYRNLPDKRSESHIKELIVASKFVQTELQKMNEAKVADTFAELLVEAFKARGHACREMAQIMSVEASMTIRDERLEREKKGLHHLADEIESRYKR